jgi:hypothetical protein
LAPRDLDPIAHTLWAQGEWYDLGQVAILITTSGEIDCEEFMEPLELLDDPLSTFYQDDGTFHQLVWERLEVPADDTGLLPPADFPGFQGLWTVAGDGAGWRSSLKSTVFHDGQITAAVPAETWLDLVYTSDPGPVTGTFSTGQLTWSFSADHCGELIAFRVF